MPIATTPAATQLRLPLTARPPVGSQRGRGSCCNPARALPDKSPRPATTTSSIRHIAHILPTIYKGKAAFSGRDMKKIFFATGNANKLKEVWTLIAEGCLSSEQQQRLQPLCITHLMCAGISYPGDRQSIAVSNKVCQPGLARVARRSGVHSTG